MDPGNEEPQRGGGTSEPGGPRELRETFLDLQSHEEAMQLFGPGDVNLKLLREAFGIQLTGRGCRVRLAGPAERLDEVLAVLEDMISRHRSGAGIPPDFVADVVARKREQSGDGSQGGAEGAPALRDLAGGAAAALAAVDGPLIRKVARSPGQASYLQSIMENELVFCVGPAGTGKTFLAVTMAIHMLKQDRIRRIVLCRPAVEAGERLGFLPGDFQAKINPYLRPLYDALNDLLDYDQIKRYMEREIIEVLPLAYMRGRTLNNAFIILDEGQNTSVSQMKMFLTRMGMNSRIIVNGDITQVDLPEGQLSGLIHAQRIMRGLAGIGWIQLEKADIVRHPLVKRIVQAYEDAEAGKGRNP